jgi:hypothetical protein
MAEMRSALNVRLAIYGHSPIRCYDICRSMDENVTDPGVNLT